MLESIKKWLLKLYLGKYRLPRDMVRDAFQRYPDRAALVKGRGRLTFADLEKRVYSLVQGLEARGINKGDRVFTLLPDGWEQIEVRLACFESGFILTPFHSAHPRSAIMKAAQLATPAALIVDPEIGQKAARDLAQKNPEMVVISTGEEGEYESMLETHRPIPSNHTIHPQDAASLGFTSGTTGKPKALFTNHEVIVTSLKLTATNVSVTPGQRDTFVLGIPLVGAGSGVVLPMLFSGSTLIIPPAYTARQVMAAIIEHRATRTFLTPSLLIDFLDMPEADLSSLRNVIYGTAPMPVPKLEEAIRRWGPIFQQGYGMAEVLPPVSLLQMDDHGTQDDPAPRQVLRSVGKIVPEVKVKIVDSGGKEVEPGEKGEILIDSPTTFNGYWKAPELNQRVLRDGWYHTRDMGSIHPRGWLHVLGRRADIIHQDGGEIFPLQVEEIAHDHPAVKEACLVGDSENQTMILAVSLRRYHRGDDPRNVAEDIKRWMAKNLPEAHHPDQVAVFNELPRSYLVKVLHREVRERILDPEMDNKERTYERLLTTTT
ncbi:MAG: acyl--CoA ligase [Anaerolineales bacterium]|nr:acyl--CoA ligase [Anaerolineales bacterium]